VKPNSDMSIDRFEREYEANPAWDIGEPQRALQQVFQFSPPESPVLEVGCGTGDLSVYLSSLGCDVLGLDFATKAIDESKSKARETDFRVEFKVHDVFSAGDLDRKFSSVVDCCFFHMFGDESRIQYEQLLKDVLEPGGRIYMLNFAIELPSPNAPRGITGDDINTTFNQGWRLLELRPETIEVTFSPNGIPGTYACIEKNV